VVGGGHEKQLFEEVLGGMLGRGYGVAFSACESMVSIRGLLYCVRKLQAV
jgi:hypothetical protein